MLQDIDFYFLMFKIGAPKRPVLITIFVRMFQLGQGMGLEPQRGI
jgi:hypothetical protein